MWQWFVGWRNSARPVVLSVACRVSDCGLSGDWMLSEWKTDIHLSYLYQSLFYISQSDHLGPFFAGANTIRGPSIVHHRERPWVHEPSSLPCAGHFPSNWCLFVGMVTMPEYRIPCVVWHVLYSIKNSSLLRLPNCLLIQPRIDHAFEAALVHCWLGFKLLVTITPKSLSSLVSSNFQTFPWVVILYSVLTECPICIVLHFCGLKPSFHLSDQHISLSRSPCKAWLSSSVEILVHSFVSSANILTLVRIHSGMSLTNTKKSSGPNTDPWSTPLVTETQSEWSPLTSTLIFRPCRNDFSQVQSFFKL